MARSAPWMFDCCLWTSGLSPNLLALPQVDLSLGAASVGLIMKSMFFEVAIPGSLNLKSLFKLIRCLLDLKVNRQGVFFWPECIVSLVRFCSFRISRRSASSAYSFFHLLYDSTKKGMRFSCEGKIFSFRSMRRTRKIVVSDPLSLIEFSMFCLTLSLSRLYSFD